MSEKPKPAKTPPIGDPPSPKRPVKAMRDPFTEQSTHPAGEGQGANRPQPNDGDQGENVEDAGPVEEGFSPVP